MDYLDIANSGWMWISVVPAVLWVLFQSYIFAKRSVKDGKRLGLTKVHFQRATRSTIIAAIGPCFVMFSGMMALMVNIGSPISWLRVNFIGSTIYELMAASCSAKALGVELGSSGMNADVLLNASLVMPLGCLGWVIFSGLFSDKMEKVNNVMSGGNKAMVPIIGGAGMIGAFSIMAVEKIFPYGPQAMATIFAGITMVIITLYNKKKNIQWLKEWGISIAMVIGMVAGSVF